MAYDTFETLHVTVDGGLALVTLNRPKVLNALNDLMVTELGSFVAAARNDDAVRVIILTGSGEKAFAAGADIGELAQAEGVRAVDLARKGQRLTRDLEQLGKPVIAAVNGFALGGGCELAMACTIRIASETALFGQPEVNLGIIPGYGGTQRLTRLVGKSRAIELMAEGRNFDMDEAAELGIVNKVFEADSADAFMDQIMEYARQFTTPGKAAMAVGHIKRACQSGAEVPLEQGLAIERELQAKLFSSADAKEGLTAFVEKRKPQFAGK